MEIYSANKLVHLKGGGSELVLLIDLSSYSVSYNEQLEKKKEIPEKFSHPSFNFDSVEDFVMAIKFLKLCLTLGYNSCSYTGKIHQMKPWSE